MGHSSSPIVYVTLYALLYSWKIATDCHDGCVSVYERFLRGLREHARFPRANRRHGRLTRKILIGLRFIIIPRNEIPGSNRHSQGSKISRKSEYCSFIFVISTVLSRTRDTIDLYYSGFQTHHFY